MRANRKRKLCSWLIAVHPLQRRPSLREGCGTATASVLDAGHILGQIARYRTMEMSLVLESELPGPQVLVMHKAIRCIGSVKQHPGKRQSGMEAPSPDADILISAQLLADICISYIMHVKRPKVPCK